jgi:hypothetical protein
MAGIPFSIANPVVFAIAAAMVMAAVGVAIVRRPAIQATTAVCGVVALVLLALAAGGLSWHRPAEGDVAVMVDLSASTRGAAYRDPVQLEQRVRQLLGTTTYHYVYFAEQNTGTAPAGATLGDLAGEKTVFAPPAGAAAVLLFSDGRFEPPAIAPPTFAVADPNLDQVNDAAVHRLQVKGDQLLITASNSGEARRMRIDGAAATTQATAVLDGGGGAVTFARTLAKDAAVASAQISKGDRWPENDGLSIPIAAPGQRQRWFVSNAGAAPDAQWIVMRPADLPSEPAAYLSPAIIVLDNVAATDLSLIQQQRLEQYVRDLGGALLIGGGDRAFSSGLYPGSALESLSPLASSPPTPAVHWMLLADSSGSMSQQTAGDATRWQLTSAAVARLLPNLPPEDPVSVGSFAAELTWWSVGKSARETAALSLPPASVSPNGPTNLAAALDRIAREADGGLAGELLVVSDADTTIDNPDDLARRLKDKKIRLHVLAIGEGRGMETLRRMTAATGGTLLRQLDPKAWAGEVRRLLAAAWPKRLMDSPVTIAFGAELTGLPARRTPTWNRTWLKGGAAPLAQTNYGEAGGIPLAARWNVGSGVVAACGFAPTPDEVAALARLIARPPRDPRFTVALEAGPRLTVRVDAVENGKYLNGLALRLELADAESADRASVVDIPQTAPGRYELSIPAPRVRSFATVWHESRVIDRLAVAGRYAPEFEAVGNDYDALRTLARRTGGRVIDRAWSKPIEIPFPRRKLLLTPFLALGAAMALAIGLIRWRMG